MRRTRLPLVLLLLTACSRNTSPPEPSASTEPSKGTPSSAAEAPASQPAAASPAAAAKPGDLGPEQAGGLKFHAPEPLVRRAPGSRMRAAEYAIATAPEHELTVFHFPGGGGGVDANITRWIGQITQKDGSNSKDKAEITKREVNGIQVTRVEVKGRYGGGMAMPAGKAPTPIDDAMLLGAVAEGPSGPVFFKWVGPTDVIQPHVEAFDALVASIAPAG